MVQEILEKKFYNSNEYYLTTGRILAHYNNAAQTKRSQKLYTKHDEDVLFVSNEDRENFKSKKVILKTQYGETTALTVAFSDKVKPKTLYTTFHHAKSRINAIFGDECDELILTPRFKSVKVEVIEV